MRRYIVNVCADLFYKSAETSRRTMFGIDGLHGEPMRIIIVTSMIINIDGHQLPFIENYWAIHGPFIAMNCCQLPLIARDGH